MGFGMKFVIIKDDEKRNKVIRFPKDLVRKIEKEASKNKISFTKFVILACKYALDNMDK